MCDGERERTGGVRVRERERTEYVRVMVKERERLTD